MKIIVILLVSLIVIVAMIFLNSATYDVNKTSKNQTLNEKKP